MKIKDFIEHFNMLTNDEDKESFLKQTVTTTYVPFIEKADICAKVINDTWYVKDPITDKRKLHITSTGTYVLYTMAVINKYTSLEVDFKNTVSQYDLLNNGNYLGMLMAYIPENELVEFRRVLEMTQNDVLQNEYYAPAYLAERIDNIALALGATVLPAVEQFGNIIENLDENKVKNFVGILDNSKVMKTLKSFMKR